MRRVRRIEGRQSLSEGIVGALRLIASPGELWATFRDYVGVGRRRRLDPVTDADSLARFLQTRASFVAQTSLYGYVRTRAGMRYPELFHDDGFVGSINIAKWQIWLACLSDLSVYAGGMLAREAPGSADDVRPLMMAVVSGILTETGTPADAGPAFASSAREVLERLSACDWAAVTDDAGAFTESPPALVRWAPIVDELKQFDEPIVLNSVRFRWQEVRRDFRQVLDVAAVLGAEPASPPAGRLAAADPAPAG